MVKALILYTLLLVHPVHVTLTSLDQAPGSDTLKVFFRMYYDDFLRDYKSYDSDFNISKLSHENPIPDDGLSSYFNDRVRIYIDNKLLTGKLEESLIDQMEISLRLVYRSEKNPVKFRIVNKVLTRIYSDQANMIYMNINNYQEALKLTVDHFTEKRNLK